MTTGWVIGVLTEMGGGAPPERCFYAVAQADQARAEWAAGDLATAAGVVAGSPSGGMEPIEAIAPLTAAAVKSLGLAPGGAKSLGPRWPRRLIGSPAPRGDD